MKAKKSGKFKIVLLILFSVIYITGAVLYAVPVGKYIFLKHRQIQTTAVFYQNAPQTNISKRYKKIYNAMYSYNEKLASGGQKQFSSEKDYEIPPLYIKDYLKGKDECIGVVSIPDIHVKLPIYNGCDEKNMSKGAALMGNTSYPTGQDNTNTVIAAHNVYESVKMFDDISKLKKGNKIYIDTYYGRLKYKVIDRNVVEPKNFDYIYIQKDKKLLTLTTCYRSDGYLKRYIVTAELKEKPSTPKAVYTTVKKDYKINRAYQILFVLSIAAIAVIYIALLKKLCRM